MADRVATGVTYTSSMITIFGAVMSLNDWAIILAGFLGICTFFINIYFKHKMCKILENKEQINIVQEIDK